MLDVGWTSTGVEGFEVGGSRDHKGGWRGEDRLHTLQALPLMRVLSFLSSISNRAD